MATSRLAACPQRGSVAHLLGIEIFGDLALIPALRQSQASVTHTLEVIVTTRQLDEALQGAERCESEFLITADERHLQPYERAVQASVVAHFQLRRLTSDNPNQQGRVAQLDDLVCQRLVRLKQNIQIRRLHGLEAARRDAEENRSAEQMRAIAGLISAMITTEQKLLHARQARTHTYQLASTIGRTAAAILAMSILLLVVMPLLLTRLRSTEATLHESEARLRLLVSSIHDPAIWMLDRDGRVVDCRME